MTTVEEWIAIFSNKESSENFLKKDYGEDYDCDTKLESILNLLNVHKIKFGNENVIIVRAPGRVNLMGRHIDHQGGCVNLIAIDREIFLTASLRNDQKVIGYNFEYAQFPEISFDFSNLEEMIQDSWINIINDKKIISNLRDPDGDWSNYFKAAYLRLIHLFKEKKLFGANFCVLGNIPIAAGLSSSSALIVGILFALLTLNNISLEEKDLVNMCAEAEWFVGTRGGAGDHVAIILGKKDKIAHVKFFELKILDWVDFPQNCALLICNTHVIADKSGSKKSLFNEKIMAYDIGFNLIKSKYPQYSKKIKFLRDVSADNLGISFEDFVNLLQKIPEYLEFKNLPEILGNAWRHMRLKFAFNNFPRKIPVRKVIVYGLSECERSKSFFRFIKNNNLKLAGKLMNISHDGDRVVSFNSKLEEKYYKNEITNDYLKSCLEKNQDFSDKKTESFRGGYGCSIPEVDFIVDLAISQEGVLGAQLSGAGLGGSAMILLEKSHLMQIEKHISENYQEKFGKNCSIYRLKPVNGCSIYSKI